MKKWWWLERISLFTMMLLKTKGITWSYMGLIWPYWKSLELNYFTNIYLNECISILLLSLLEKRTVNRSFSFRNPKESWISHFVMIVEISTEHRALNHIPFIYLIFLAINAELSLVVSAWHMYWCLRVTFDADSRNLSALDLIWVTQDLIQKMNTERAV